jgi:hypothetical protein
LKQQQQEQQQQQQKRLSPHTAGTSKFYYTNFDDLGGGGRGEDMEAWSNYILRYHSTVKSPSKNCS